MVQSDSFEAALLRASKKYANELRFVANQSIKVEIDGACSELSVREIVYSV